MNQPDGAMHALRIPEGTIICCPNKKCGVRIARARRHIMSNEILHPEMFKFYYSKKEVPREVRVGTPMLCFKCHAFYGRYVSHFFKVHTMTLGWI